MTVSYKKAGQGGGSYYTLQASEVDDYYTASEKEPPGVWYVAANQYGQRKTQLGITDELSFSSEDTKKFKALVNGLHPETNNKLVQNAGAKNRVALHDFTLSPPKSISVIWSQASDKMKVEIERVKFECSRSYMDYLSEHAVVRLAGKERGSMIHAKAFVRGAIFVHGSSRENDPQAHDHFVLMNVAESEDGRTGALETRDMMRWQGAAASLFHADLAYKFRQAGFSIRKDKNLFEIDGVPDNVLKEFSRRREEMTKLAEASGIDIADASRELLQKLALESRPGKNELSRTELIALWRERGAAIGFTEKQVNEIIGLDTFVDLTPEQCRAEVKNVVDQITKTKAVFGEPELVAKAASAMIGLASREQIIAAIEAYKSELLVSHGEHTRDTVFTNREMVTLEHEMLELCEDRNGKHIIEDFNLPESLSGEQRAAAEGVLRDENYLTIVEGAAGAGKTYTMASVARVYEANGYKVHGLAVAWTAALNLKKDADLAVGAAITGWINAAKKGEAGLDNKSLLILDEVGVVSARQMRDVLAVARQYGVKVVALGDRKQQKSVEAGDCLSPMVQRLGSFELKEIKRQNRVEEREAVKHLFEGNAAEALETFSKRDDGFTVRDGDDDVNEALVDDWVASRSRTIGDSIDFSREGKELSGQIVSQDANFWTVSTGEELHKVGRTHLILASDNRSVRSLNQLAQERLLERGLLGEGRLLGTIDGEQALHVGDEIQIRSNSAEHEVYNRMRGRIEGFEGDVMQVRMSDDRLLPMNLNEKAWRTEDGELAVQLAYATTTYSSQGLTVGHTFVKDGWSLARDSAGVAMSRHRESVHVYADRVDHHERAMRKTLADQWRPVQEFSDADVLASIAKCWSRDNVKASTLNHIWQEPDGAIVDRAYLLAEQKEAERVAKSREPEALGQKQPLPDLERASDRQISRAMEKLQLAGIDYEALKIAGEQGILRVDGATGEPVFLGRKGDGALMQVLPLDGPQKPDLRGRFPPILRGEGDKTLVVQDGMEALRTLTNYLDAGEPTPNLIITGGKPFALSGPQAKELLAGKDAKAEKKQSAQSVERDRSNDSARSERAAAIAQAEEASRRATAALQEQAQRPPERDAGLTR